MDSAFEFRPPLDGEEAFLFELFFHARRDSFMALGWPEAQLRAFLGSQHAIQQSQYRAKHPGAVVRIIVVDGTPAGRVDTDWGPDAFHLIDIALMPAFRSKGIGARVLKALIAEGEARSLPMDLHVEVENPAQRLYRRLGFQESGSDGVYLFMMRPAGGGASE